MPSGAVRRPPLMCAGASGGGCASCGCAGGLHGLAVLEAEDLRVVGLDLAQLVHELQLVDADVARAVAGGLQGGASKRSLVKN